MFDEPDPPEFAGWSQVLQQLGPLLNGSSPEVHIPGFLKAVRRQYGWPVAEYWVADDFGYRIAFESHADLEQLHRLERESCTVVIPSEWVRMEHWHLQPAPDEALFKRIYWSTSATLSRVTIRGGMLAEAGLKTQVAIPVPGAGSRRDILMLFDMVSRRPAADEVNMLGIAVLLLSWAGTATPRAFMSMAEPGEPASRLDPDTRHLLGPQGAVRLTVYEWDLLSTLFVHAGRVVGFDEIARAVWDTEEEHVGRAVMYELIARVRRHLTLVGDDYRLENVPGHGYLLQAQRETDDRWQSKYFNLEAIL